MTAMLLLSACSDEKSEETFFLQGAWTLKHVEYPIGTEYDYPQDGTTFCRIYDRDSTLYECHMSETPTGLIIVPNYKADIMFADHGDRLLYLEDDDPRPLTVKNDSIIVIQRNGVLFTWQRAKEIGEQWGGDIRDIIRTELQGDADGVLHHYVLSAKEQEQENVIHGFTWFSIVIIIMVFAIARIAVSNRREKRRLMLQLKQIQEVQENRPQVIRLAMETVEGEFLASDEYQSLLRRIASGQRLREEEWDDIESLTRQVWPGFSSQLRSLYPMSELEYQVVSAYRRRTLPLYWCARQAPSAPCAAGCTRRCLARRAVPRNGTNSSFPSASERAANKLQSPCKEDAKRKCCRAQGKPVPLHRANSPSSLIKQF